MKIRKNALLLTLIVSLLISAFAFAPSFAQEEIPTLAAPTIDDIDLVPGSEFYVLITVDDVVAKIFPPYEEPFGLVAFQFILYYSEDVLTAISGEGLSGFETALYLDIGDGYLKMANGLPAPAYPPGFETVNPVPIARIGFIVDEYGASGLDLEGTLLASFYGIELDHTVVDGWFRNSGAPIATFGWTPETPMAEETVTFTSTSTDPGGNIVSHAWDFGDGTSATTTEPTATHVYDEEGEYTVTLTVTDDTDLTGSVARTITVVPPPKTGAVARKVWASHGIKDPLDFSKTGDHKLISKVTVENLDKDNPTLVRPVLQILSVSGGNPPHKAIEMSINGTWINAGASHLFQSDEFDMLDPGWGFAGQGAPREKDKEYMIVPIIYYMDYWMIEPNATYPGMPHWTVWPDAPELAWNFMCHEDGPVGVGTFTETADPRIVTFDASASWDPDEKWGDDVLEWYWFVFDLDYNLWGYLGGETYTYDFRGALGPGDYLIRLRVVDYFGIRGHTWYELSVRGPTAAFTLDPDPQKTKRPVTFDASASTDTYGTIVSYEWDFGDGTTATTTDPVIEHTYDTVGTYTVTLTITDDYGLTDTTSDSVTIVHKLPK